MKMKWVTAFVIGLIKKLITSHIIHFMVETYIRFRREFVKIKATSK